jgi:hypothetical protein
MVLNSNSLNTWNNGVYMSPNGLQSINAGSDSFNTIQNSISELNKNDFISRIRAASADDIQVYYYAKRQWVMCKIGQIIWNLNLSPVLNEQGDLEAKGTWSLYTGKFSQQNHYLVRSNGVLYACGANGRVYIMDDGDFTDDGQIIETQMIPARYYLEEPQRTNRIKRTYFIRPLFESGGNVPYTVSITGGWDNISSDEVVVTAAGSTVIGNFVVGQSIIGGQSIQAEKRPLRCRGENFELNFQTATSAGPDIISSYTLYGEISGRR